MPGIALKDNRVPLRLGRTKFAPRLCRGPAVREFSLGKSARHLHGDTMSDDPQSGERASLLAEEILRTIYGDDLKGCAVSLDSIAAIVAKGIKQSAPANELMALYEQVIEATHRLSAPPAKKIADAKELQELLSDRLDSIRDLTTKTLDMAARFKAHGGAE